MQALGWEPVLLPDEASHMDCSLCFGALRPALKQLRYEKSYHLNVFLPFFWLCFHSLFIVYFPDSFSVQIEITIYEDRGLTSGR